MTINKSIVPEQVIPFIPPGKIRCFITGKLRKDTPEENIRQRWVRSLVEEYKYNKVDIALEFPIKMGVAVKKADIVIFKEGTVREQQNIFIIVEAKRADIDPKSSLGGVGQLKSYMAASSCKYGLWVGKERQGFEKLANGSIADGLSDIPFKGDLELKIPRYKDLTPALDLKAIFHRCHNYIYVNEGLQKAEAFHEMLKLIFCKVYDETESTGDLRFYVRNEEQRSEAGQRRLKTERIDPLFELVKDRYPWIFERHDTLKLKLRVLAYIVSELQRISLLRTQADIKGAAYEELVGENLRGNRGEYFTPRNVCDMATKIVTTTYPINKLTTVRVLDLCCGTGGFLVSFLNHLRQILTTIEVDKSGISNSVVELVSTRVKDVCSQNLFGLDINPFLVRTCQMNLVMHGDGSANVYEADSLHSPSEWDNQQTAPKVGFGQFDIVLTNPPFGGEAIVDDPHLLSRYELASFGTSGNIRSSLPAEQLFIEASLNFLKPGGRLGIVLPDSILNNPGLEFIRRWLLRRTRIFASIDLPKETFATSGGVPNPSVLVVQKLTREEIRLAEAGGLENYEAFMAIPKTSGIDKRGNPVYLRTPNGLEILGPDQLPQVNDEIALVADKFLTWVREKGYVTS